MSSVLILLIILSLFLIIVSVLIWKSKLPDNDKIASLIMRKHKSPSVKKKDLIRMLHFNLKKKERILLQKLVPIITKLKQCIKN